jgi:hypothetical protein
MKNPERGKFLCIVGFKIERSHAAAFFDQPHDGRVTEIAEPTGHERDFSF